MRPVPIIERIYREEGAVEGLRAAVENIVERRFGGAEQGLIDQIRAVKYADDLQKLVTDVAIAQSLDEVRVLVAKAQAAQ